MLNIHWYLVCFFLVMISCSYSMFDQSENNFGGLFASKNEWRLPFEITVLIASKILSVGSELDSNELAAIDSFRKFNFVVLTSNKQVKADLIQWLFNEEENNAEFFF